MTRLRRHYYSSQYVYRKRAVVAVKVAILSVLLVGFAALGVDVGLIYNARIELRRAVDASALAAASALKDTVGAQDFDDARAIAIDCAARNKVAGDPLYVSAEDVQFGWAEIDASTGAYAFAEDPNNVNAVRVTGRRSGDNEVNGPVPLVFAAVLGFGSTNMVRSSTALMQPRDIAIVADLSDSHNDDSELRSLHALEINLGDVWDFLPGGTDDGSNSWHPGWQTGPLSVLSEGFGWGFFQRNPAGQSYGLGFGYDVASEDGPTRHIQIDGYDPKTDNGLIYLPLGFDEGGNQTPVNWDPAARPEYAELASYLTQLGYVGAYGDAAPPGPPATSELTGILGDHTVGMGAFRWFNWVYRTAVATGYAKWNSGIPGGLWEQEGLDPPAIATGYGDQIIHPWEVEWGAAILGDRTKEQMQALWEDYARYYMAADDTAMTLDGHPDFRWRFGPKTFTNYLLERRPDFASTPELSATPAQPSHAEKEAIAALTGSLSVEYADLLSLEVYSTTVHHEVDLTDNVASVPERLSAMQAGHYDRYTNIGGGIREGRATLLGPNARINANKVIVLITDGNATAWEHLSSDGPGGVPVGEPEIANTEAQAAEARNYALQQAAWARDEGVRIYCVSIGVSADQALMEDIAELTGGEHFHAGGGSIEAYSAELLDIFGTIAILRPVTLVE